MIEFIRTQYIDGAWRDSAGIETLPVFSPASGDIIANVTRGHPEDVNAAVAAAQKAFPAWQATPPARRIALLERIRDGMERNADELARTVSVEMGAPMSLARSMHLQMPLTNLQATIQALGEFEWERAVKHTLVVREPIGVVAALTPWNAPLHQIIAKVIPALGSGCCVVLKPSETAPLSARLLTQIIADAGAPPGVFNLVCGDGEQVGAPLSTHPDVGLISFTGSVAVGKRIMVAAAGGVKRLVMELGGKSASIVLDDAVPDRIAATALRQCWINAGQVCVALSRLLVPRGQQARYEGALRRHASEWRLGKPEDLETSIGPLATRAQRDRVRRYMTGALEEGARLVYGGLDAPLPSTSGYYVAPTIFADVTPRMTIAREEIFGPVLTLMPYDSEEEAIAIANALPYGLSGAVWSDDSARALSVARRMRTGQVVINGAPQNLAAPFGGYRESGIGRENGGYGLEAYLEYKSIQGGAGL